MSKTPRTFLVGMPSIQEHLMLGGAGGGMQTHTHSHKAACPEMVILFSLLITK